MTLPNNIWNSPVTRDRLFAEACFNLDNGKPEKTHYHFYVKQSDGIGYALLVNYAESIVDIAPHEMQVEFAKTTREIVQKRYHHDGFWIVGWTHPPTVSRVLRPDGDNCWDRFLILWADEDGDIKFAVESVDSFIEIMKNGEDYYADLAAQAWESWNEVYGKRAVRDDFGLTEDQLGKPALESLGKV